MTKMHHATVDGVSAAPAWCRRCAASNRTHPPSARCASRHRRRRAPVTASIVAGRAAAVSRRGRCSSRRLLPQHARRPSDVGAPRAPRRGDAGTVQRPATSFNGTVTGHRSVAFTRMELTEVKEVKNAFGTTVNDVVLSMCSGALRRTSPTTTSCPTARWSRWCRCRCTARPSRRTNKVSGMFAGLSSDIADPVERLHAIARTNRGRQGTSPDPVRRRCCRTGRSSQHRTRSGSRSGCTRGCGWPIVIRSSTTW